MLLEIADELRLIAVVDSDDINAELFLEVDWRDTLRPSWAKSSMAISNYHVLEDNDGSESCVPIWLRRTVHDGCRCALPRRWHWGISFGWVSFLPTIDTFVSVVYVCFNPMINWGKLKEEAWGRRWDCLIDF